MRIVKQRFYGEPKLVKPKFCNNKNLLGCVEWNKHCGCKLWAYGDKYYLLHKDWFSNFLSFSEAKNRGIIDQWNTKFVYNDNFGSVVLRNEALIEFSREDWYKPTPSMSTNLCLSTEKMLNLDEYSLVHYEWEHLYEQCLNLITPLKFDTETQWF